ncbi:unnamed protein product [Alternaria alternata]
MPSTYKEIISEPEFFRTSYAMVALASTFILARVSVQVWMRRAMESQDYFLYAAFIFFLAMSICYLIVIPKIYAIAKVQVGLLQPWPSILDDILVYVRTIFVTTTLFWLALWSVKLSLLALYKKLLEGLPTVWKKLWWAVIGFCTVALIGCIISYFTSCPDFTALIMDGECTEGPRSVRGQLASLYMSYAVDILSDFMIMLLPIRLVWNLQMARAQKIAVVALFSSGFVVVTFATLRVVQVGIKTGNSTSPSPTWLAFWTIIESAVAICIGCCPAFAVFYRNTHTPHVSYDTSGYVRHNQSRSGADPNYSDAIKMNAVAVSSSRKKVPRRDIYWDDTRSSQEELAADNKNIMVTTTLQQDNSRSDLEK